MGVLRASKAAPDSALRLIARRLREESEDITQEPLPARLRDLVRELDRCAEAEKEKASLKIEVLEELLSTSEPTAKTRAVLEAFMKRSQSDQRKKRSQSDQRKLKPETDW
jgi:hypothetical protein